MENREKSLSLVGPFIEWLLDKVNAGRQSRAEKLAQAHPIKKTASAIQLNEYIFALFLKV